jgi:ribonuclease BN (tRNA processing enzyme)
LIHAKHVSTRTAPLTITGPAGIEARFKTVAEALYPGSTKTKPNFDLTFIDYVDETAISIDGVTVTPYRVSHPSGAPPYAVRVAVSKKVIAFSGDTEWTESLIAAADRADLFIADCFGFDDPAGYHMSWRIIEKNIPRLTAKRIMLSHMGLEMLAKADTIKHPRVIVANDGMKIDI